MREDYFRGVVFKTAQGDETLPLDLFVAARNCESCVDSGKSKVPCPEAEFQYFASP